jgi:hypothetical protein
VAWGREVLRLSPPHGVFCDILEGVLFFSIIRSRDVLAHNL